MKKHLKKYISKIGITVRIVIYFAILVVIPFLLLTLGVFVAFQNYVLSSLGETTADAMAVAGAQIERAMREIEDDSMVFYYNGCVETLSLNHPITEEQKAQMEDALVASCYTDTGIRAAYIETETQILSAGNFPEAISLMAKNKNEIIAAGGACCWYVTDQLHGKAKENMYILARTLNSKEEKNIGIVYMVLDGRIVQEAYAQMKSSYSIRYLVDSDGRVLYSSDQAMLKKTLDLSMLNPKLRSNYQTVSTKKNKKQIMVSYRLMDSGWYCISTIDTKNVLLSTKQLVIPFICISTVYLAFLFVMLSMMKKYVFNPLRLLKKSMDKYAKENIENVNMEPIGIGEFQSLSLHFNNMNSRIYNLMQEYKNEVDEKNKQKMKALTSQLTPHFIYNALNTIKWMAVLNHQDNIQNITEALIYILMNAAQVEDNNYTVSNELRLIQNYAVIQKARFMNFDLVIEKEPSGGNCKIRKFLIQPIVENAIVHGLGRGKASNSTILVKVWTDENLHIIVQDQGAGFDVEQWRNNPQKEDKHTNLGIHSIEQIIQLEYGETYGLRIESAPGKGTSVSYTLPIVRKDR